ncbi:MAG: L,D-transpeptidase family protein, partial [Gammaproteobacteria bacterium]
MGLSSRLWNAMLWVALGAAAFAAPVASVASVATAASASTTPSFDSRTARLRDSDLPIATHVVVHKAERRLEIFQGDEQMREFRIALGGDPTGHKLFEGDSRTPEGRYMLGV